MFHLLVWVTDQTITLFAKESTDNLTSADCGWLKMMALITTLGLGCKPSHWWISFSSRLSICFFILTLYLWNSRSSVASATFLRVTPGCKRLVHTLETNEHPHSHWHLTRTQESNSPSSALSCPTMWVYRNTNPHTAASRNLPNILCFQSLPAPHNCSPEGCKPLLVSEAPRRCRLGNRSMAVKANSFRLAVPFITVALS